MLTENSSYNDRTIYNAIKDGFKLKVSDVQLRLRARDFPG